MSLLSPRGLTAAPESVSRESTAVAMAISMRCVWRSGFVPCATAQRPEPSCHATDGTGPASGVAVADAPALGGRVRPVRAAEPVARAGRVPYTPAFPATVIGLAPSTDDGSNAPGSYRVT